MKRETERYDRTMGPMKPKGCRWCGGKVAPPRRTFCCQDHVDEYLIRRSHTHLRRVVFSRDAGICANCGCDTEWLRAAVRAVWAAETEEPASYSPTNFRRRVRVRAGHGSTSADQLARRLGFYCADWLVRSWWDADHVVPVVNGGGRCGLENIRTLCVPCHRAATARLAAERAAERRDAGALLFTGGGQ